MAKEKLNNLLKFTDYDHLQPIQKPTKKTEIGGFSVLEGYSVKELLKLASKNSGKSKKELKELSPKKLKKLAGISKEKTEVQEDEKNESLIVEKASAKQIAARKKFMDMISSKKKSGDKDDEKEVKDEKKPAKGLTAKQKRLPEALQKAILKRQK